MADSADTAIQVSGGTNNTIAGNFIGTDSSGQPAFHSSERSGCTDQLGRRHHVLAQPDQHEQCSRHSRSTAGRHTITGNRIDANDSGGILVNAGGSTIGPGNTFAENQDYGIRLALGNGTRITQNAIDDTFGPGIDLVSGANNNQTAPIVTSATGSGGNIQVVGSLASAANTAFRLEFFRSQSCSSGAGEAFLGATTQSTDGLGHLNFNLAVPASGSGTNITATATDPSGNTSAFSGCVPMSGAAASTFTVNTQADSTDGSCTLALCSLRDAIVAANAAPGADKIAFDIEPAALWTIKPTSQLPIVTDPVTIDGTTEPGTPPNTPGIELDGENAGSSNGLEIDAGNSTVRGLVINRFAADGIFLQTGTLNTIVGNYLGTNAAGQASSPNGHGIEDNSGNNLIGGTTAADRNVISGNSLGGVHLIAAGSTVEGNYIGTDATGTFAVGNGDEGILVQAQNSTIGGTAPGAGNVIAASTIVSNGHGDGIGLYAPNNLVQGNLIGTNATGTVALPNAARGILINGVSGNTVGGTTAAARNVISGNTGTAIMVGNAAGNNTIEGNYLGLQADGTTPLHNANGIQVFGGAGNQIGGTAAGAGNVISSNTNLGILLNQSASATTVQGNLIGTDKTGTLDRGNGSSGILISPADTTTIGGVAAGAGNTIAFNGIDGVEVDGGVGNSIRGNSIFSNHGEPDAGLGIDLDSPFVGPFGVLPNDPGDPDHGANEGQNYPVITQATSTVGTTVDGTLNSVASTIYHLDFYSNPSCDVSGFGEGQLYVGSQDVTTDGGGNAAFSASFPSVTVATGDAVSATATDPAGNTSEFAQCVTVNASGGGGSLTGAVQQDPPVDDVNLSALGTEDWAIWGSGDGGTGPGTSTSLAPNSRKLGANEISSLTNIDPAPSVVLRGLGQFGPPTTFVPFYFGWANGTTPMNASHVIGGLQHDGETQHLSTLNHGFGFTVPADTRSRTLRVYVATNRADGTSRQPSQTDRRRNSSTCSRRQSTCGQPSTRSTTPPLRPSDADRELGRIGRQLQHHIPVRQRGDLRGGAGGAEDVRRQHGGGPQ